jgi:hypothetical protein
MKFTDVRATSGGPAAGTAAPCSGRSLGTFCPHHRGSRNRRWGDWTGRNGRREIPLDLAINDINPLMCSVRSFYMDKNIEAATTLLI